MSESLWLPYDTGIKSFPADGDQQQQLNKLPTILFRNDAGSTAPAHGILRVTGLVNFPNAAGEPFLTVDQPNTYGAQYSHAINMGEDVESGGYGKCTLGIANVALYDSADGTPAFGESWGPRSGTWKLKKNTGGLMVVGIPTTSTYKRVLVAPAPMLETLGAPGANIANNATGSFSVNVGGTQGAESDTLQTLTAYVREGIVLASKRYKLRWKDGLWEVQNPIKSIVGVADADVAKGSAGTVSVWTAWTGSFADSGMNVSVTFLGAGVSATKWVRADWVDSTGDWQGGGEC